MHARTARPIVSSTSRTRTRTCSRNLAQIILSRCQLPNYCIISSRHTHMQHQYWIGIPSLSIRAYLSCCYNDVRGLPLVCSTRCSSHLNTLRRIPRELGVTTRYAQLRPQSRIAYFSNVYPCILQAHSTRRRPRCLNIARAVAQCSTSTRSLTSLVQADEDYKSWRRR
jgi:hypothetical protein